MNKRGDFLLYIIFTIIILLIGAILVYVYVMPQDANSTSTGDTIDFRTQYTTKNVTETLYTKQYPIKTKLRLEMGLDISDKNINILGKPEILVSERIFILKDPTLTKFSGTLDKTGLQGNVDSINSKDASLDLRTSVSTSFQNIDKLTINNMYLDLETPNISGELDISGKLRTLNKSYLQIKGFNGKLTVIPDLNKEYATLELDGNVGYLKYIDGVEETILK